MRIPIALTTREGTSPSLARSVRVGTFDLAVVISRQPHHAPDDELPAPRADVLGESSLMIAAAATGPFGGRPSVAIERVARAARNVQPA